MVSLDRRVGELEDTELEVMEQLEDAQRELDALTARLAEIDDKIQATTDSRTKVAGEVEEQLTKVADDRKVTASDMPTDLMALYEKLRGQKGGVGAAALRARRCGGCSLELNAADLGVIAKRPPTR